MLVAQKQAAIKFVGQTQAVQALHLNPPLFFLPFPDRFFLPLSFSLPSFPYTHTMHTRSRGRMFVLVDEQDV